MAGDRLTSWVVSAIALAGAVGCAPVTPRNPETVIAEVKCKAWARNAAQDEYARDARTFATAPQTVVAGGAGAGAVYGMAGLGSALTDIARQGRERELVEACMAQNAPVRGPAAWAPRRQTPPSPEPTSAAPRSSCDFGMYWNSAKEQCMKIGEE
jgi:hypothetical protein